MGVQRSFIQIEDHVPVCNSDGFAAEDDFVAPEPATNDDILLVHGQEWVRKLRSGTLTYTDILRLEIPYSREMVDAVWLSAGGSILAPAPWR